MTFDFLQHPNILDIESMTNIDASISPYYIQVQASTYNKDQSDVFGNLSIPLKIVSQNNTVAPFYIPPLQDIQVTPNQTYTLKLPALIDYDIGDVPSV